MRAVSRDLSCFAERGGSEREEADDCLRPQSLSVSLRASVVRQLQSRLTQLSSPKHTLQSVRLGRARSSCRRAGRASIPARLGSARRALRADMSRAEYACLDFEVVERSKERVQRSRRVRAGSEAVERLFAAVAADAPVLASSADRDGARPPLLSRHSWTALVPVPPRTTTTRFRRNRLCAVSTRCRSWALRRSRDRGHGRLLRQLS